MDRGECLNARASGKTDYSWRASRGWATDRVFFGVVNKGTVRAIRASICVAVVLVMPMLAAAELKVGDLAPPFSLPGSDGKTYRLADYKGKQAVVVAWFAKAFTSG